MNLLTRLENMRKYRDVAIAQNDPSDKLYIEDLNTSIAYFEEAITKPKKQYEIINAKWLDE